MNVIFKRPHKTYKKQTNKQTICYPFLVKLFNRVFDIKNKNLTKKFWRRKKLLWQENRVGRI